MLSTKIMGILNATPDSFYPESRYCSFDEDYTLAITCAKDLESQGANYIDIGGESTRPGAIPVPEDEELRRVVPLIKALKPEVNVPISIDTMKPKVARAAIEAGAELINDVSGFSSPEMREIAASHNIPICAVHMRPQPGCFKGRTFYEEGVINAITKWFDKTLDLLINSGVSEKNIIIDPGIGFGKTVADNFEILQNLNKLIALRFPLLIGISRKSFMGKTLDLPPSKLLPATIALNTLAIQAGVDYIRVHDVKEHKESILVLNQLVSCC